METSLAYDAVLCRYGELALKGQNRKHFEKLLQKNIKRGLRKLSLQFVPVRGRLLFHKKDSSPFTSDELDYLKTNLSRAFGLVSFSPGFLIKPVLEDIEACIYDNFPMILARYGDRQVRYRMRARRSNKSFPLRSKEMEIRFADVLLTKYPNLKLDLVDAEFTIRLEVRDEAAFVSLESVPCPGGLPAGCSSPALVLLSGGIDSPVASYMMMSRGCKCNFLTFHSYPYTKEELIDKVGKLVKQLNLFQGQGKLYACNLAQAQRIIRDECQEKYRTVFYRRLMMRVSEALAAKTGDEALVTGEAVGQVSSQTVRNLTAINNATNMLVLRPLIGVQKEFIIDIARKIETFDLSNIDCADSCTVFMPQAPVINTPVGIIEEEESKLDMADLLEKSLATIQLVNLASFELEEIDFFKS